MKRLIFKLKVSELKDSEHYKYIYTLEQRKWLVYVYILICSPILIPLYLAKHIYTWYWKQFDINEKFVKSNTFHNKKMKRKIFKQLLQNIT